MKRPTRREVILAVVFVVVVAVLLFFLPGRGPAGGSADDPGRVPVRASSSFTISGAVRRPISPGELAALDLTLDNTSNLDLVIDRITVAVVGIDAPRADADHPCTAGDFEVRHLTGGAVLRLPRNSTNNLSGLNLPEENWPAVGMLNHPVNQDGCKGASLTLSYEASGVEVPR
jgi:hypothetical protein